MIPADLTRQETREARERAKDALDTLASGSEPLSDSGYGYEHMGDMARDLQPLAQDVLTLAARVVTLTEALRERDRLIAIQVAYQKGERKDGVAVWDWPAALASGEPQT